MSSFNGVGWKWSSLIPSTGMYPDGVLKLDYLPTGNVMTIRGNGALGLRKTNPIYTLDVNGSIYLTGRLLPNGIAGQSGDLLVSDGAGKPPIWKSFPQTVINSYFKNDIVANGLLTGIDSHLLQTLSFSTTDSTKVNATFSLDVKAQSGTGDAYGIVEIELFNQNDNVSITTHKVFFKCTESNFTLVNFNKLFMIKPQFPGISKVYQLKVRIRRSTGGNIQYGSYGGMVNLPAGSAFIAAQVIKK
jgi:hypothetical protein